MRNHRFGHSRSLGPPHILTTSPHGTQIKFHNATKLLQLYFFIMYRLKSSRVGLKRKQNQLKVRKLKSLPVKQNLHQLRSRGTDRNREGCSFANLLFFFHCLFFSALLKEIPFVPVTGDSNLLRLCY